MDCGFETIWCKNRSMTSVKSWGKRNFKLQVVSVNGLDACSASIIMIHNFESSLSALALVHIGKTIINTSILDMGPRWLIYPILSYPWIILNLRNGIEHQLIDSIKSPLARRSTNQFIEIFYSIAEAAQSLRYQQGSQVDYGAERIMTAWMKNVQSHGIMSLKHTLPVPLSARPAVSTQKSVL